MAAQAGSRPPTAPSGATCENRLKAKEIYLTTKVNSEDFSTQ